MEIKDCFIFEIKPSKHERIKHFVYEGTCDGIPTKWITKSKWDYKITVEYLPYYINTKQLKYSDSNGDEIIIFEENDDGYNFFKKQ
jgi:hypothetical protein